jgi:hypothetical protein
MNNKTFLGDRGIRPLSKRNVFVPSLRLTFDLPGVPYSEPCYANCALIDTLNSNHRNSKDNSLSQRRNQYLRECLSVHLWPHALLGVVYELKMVDFRQVIATEGGGTAYQQLCVECFVLHEGESLKTRETTQQENIFAYTLYAPRQVFSTEAGSDKGSVLVRRRYASTAQPSYRYLSLIRDGAAEHDLPSEFLEFLARMPSYQVTSKRQLLGKLIFLAVWKPIMTFVLSLQQIFQEEDGTNLSWLVHMLSLVFGAMWYSHDVFFRSVFGDGERSEIPSTVGQAGLHNAQQKGSAARWKLG